MPQKTPPEIQTLGRPKEKSFIQKIKDKINKMFDSDNLTFLGKIFCLLNIILLFNVISMAIFSVLQGIANYALKILNLESNFGFPFIWGVMIATLVVGLILDIILICIESVAQSGGDSVLSKE